MFSDRGRSQGVTLSEAAAPESTAGSSPLGRAKVSEEGSHFWMTLFWLCIICSLAYQAMDCFDKEELIH